MVQPILPGLGRRVNPPAKPAGLRRPLPRPCCSLTAEMLRRTPRGGARASGALVPLRERAASRTYEAAAGVSDLDSVLVSVLVSVGVSDFVSVLAEPFELLPPFL